MSESSEALGERIARFMTREGPRFGLAMLVHADRVVADELRTKVVDELAAKGKRITTLELSYTDEREDLVQRMAASAADVDGLFVVGLDRLATDSMGRPRTTTAIANLNLARDKLPERFDQRVVFWVAKAAYPALLDVAGDFLQMMLSVFELDAMREAGIELRVQDPPLWMALAEDGERPALEAQHERLAAVFESATDASSRADAAASAGELALRLGWIDRAREWLARAQGAYAEAGQPREAGMQARRLAEISISSGRLEDAETFGAQALAHAREAGDMRAQVLARAVLAELTGRRGKLEEAIVELEYTLAPKLEGEARALVFMQIADLLEARGDLDEALRLRRERIALLLSQGAVSELGERARRVNAAKLAAGLIRKGKLDEALPVGVGLLPAGELPAGVLLHLAQLQEVRGDLDAAEQLRREAAERAAGDPRSQAEALRDEAETLHEAKRCEEAVSLLRERALPAFTRIGDERARVLVLGRIAEWLAELGQREEAMDVLQDEMEPAALGFGDARLIAMARMQLTSLLRIESDEIQRNTNSLRSEAEDLKKQLLGKVERAESTISVSIRGFRRKTNIAIGLAIGIASFGAAWSIGRSIRLARQDRIHACQIVKNRELITLDAGEEHELDSHTVVQCRADVADVRVAVGESPVDLSILRWPIEASDELHCAQMWTACTGTYECLAPSPLGCTECECIEDDAP